MIRQLARLALSHAGYEVRPIARPHRVEKVDQDSDPITFEYMPQRRGHVVFEVPLADTRGFNSLGLLIRPECHPFVRALESAIGEGGDKVRSTIEEILRRYYQSVLPGSAAEVVGLSLDEAPGLRGVAPSDCVLPWSAQSLTEIGEGQRRNARFEGFQNGVLAHVSLGMTDFGPVQPAKLSLEVTRLANLLASVKSRGFIPFDRRSPLKVAAFRRDGEYKWVIESGQHRFAMASAVGIESVPATVIRVVRREDAPYWPQVVSGVFTERGALAIFDRIFDGVPAPVCETWLRGNG